MQNDFSFSEATEELMLFEQSFKYLVIQQKCIEYLLYDKHFASHWKKKICQSNTYEHIEYAFLILI